MSEKLKLAILFGGQSGEHEVSLMSATSVINNIDRDKYSLYLIGITKSGNWMMYNGDPDKIEDGSWEKSAVPIVFPADPSYGGFFLLSDPSRVYEVDVIFPVMHGPHAEDGTIQGLFELAQIPYVGCDVVASSTGMDKAISKDIFQRHNLPQAKYRVILKRDYIEEREKILSYIESIFDYPVFIKPANLGSSVGISKCYHRDELAKGLDNASEYDRKIIVEEFIDGYEIECAVLGNNHPKASVLGQIIPCNDFYDYDAKYFGDGKSKLVIPAPLSEQKTNEIRTIAIQAFKALDCSGLARVDFFVHGTTDDIYLNEINTMPGFTKISMYPKLWEESGIPYAELMDKLIDFALDRFNEKHNM